MCNVDCHLAISKIYVANKVPGLNTDKLRFVPIQIKKRFKFGRLQTKESQFECSCTQMKSKTKNVTFYSVNYNCTNNKSYTAYRCAYNININLLSCILFVYVAIQCDDMLNYSSNGTELALNFY